MKKLSDFPELHRYLSLLMYDYPHSTSINVSIRPADDHTGEVNISIEDYGHGPKIHGEVFTALSRLFEVPMNNIIVEAMQETFSGCDTCGHGSKSEGAITVTKIPPGVQYRVEHQAKELADDYTKYIETERAEQAEYQRKQQIQDDLDRAARRLANEQANEAQRQANVLKKARESIFLNTFMVAEKKIFNKIATEFEKYRGMERPALAQAIKEHPYRALFFKFHTLAECSRPHMHAVFDHLTKNNPKLQMQLVQEFVNVD